MRCHLHRESEGCRRFVDVFDLAKLGFQDLAPVPDQFDTRGILQPLVRQEALPRDELEVGNDVVFGDGELVEAGEKLDVVVERMHILEGGCPSRFEETDSFRFRFLNAGDDDGRPEVEGVGGGMRGVVGVDRRSGEGFGEANPDHLALPKLWSFPKIGISFAIGVGSIVGRRHDRTRPFLLLLLRFLLLRLSDLLLLLVRRDLLLLG